MSDTSTGLTIGYTTAVTAATALTDAATLTLSRVGAGSSYTATGIENLTINSTGGANVLGNVGSNGLAGSGLVRLTLTGDQALTINGTVGGTTITTLDASAATGAITVATGAGTGTTANSNVGITVTAPTAATAGLFTATTGSQRDVVTLGAGNAVLDTGAGNDTITSGAGTNTITPGAGNDTINVTTGKDTIRFADVGNANADSITNFSVANTVMSFATSTVPTATALAGAGTFGGLTTATPGVPALVGVAGTNTTNAFAATNYQEISAATAVLGTSAVVELTGVFTNGTAQGAIDALGVSATTGITTTPAGKFLLVTYAVGNTAQVWSYGGDGTGTGTVNTDIDAAELSLVATLSNVALGSLGLANFGVYASGTATTTAVSATGGTIVVSAPLTTITSTANTAGQVMTAANESITVNTGVLPTGGPTTTTGLTILDDSSTDNDSFTATVLGDFAAGTLLVGIETVNLNYLVAGTAFNAASRTPGTTTFNFTGTQNTGAITAAPAAVTIGLGAARAGVASVDLAAAGPYSVTLNGAGVAPTSVTAAPTTAAIATNGTTATITATGSNFISTNGQANLFGTSNTLKTLTGTGSVDISGATADFGSLNLVTSATYSGSLTLRPSNDGTMDLTGTNSTVNGVRTIDYTAVTTPAPTITLDAANGTAPTVIRTANATSNAAGGFGAVSVTQAGTGITDAVTITVANATAGNTSGIGAVTAPGVEILVLNLGGTATSATKAVASVTMDATAAPQALTVTSSALATTLGTVTADSINTTGVAGTLTAAFTAGIASAVFTGSTTTASYITGTGNNDIITTGSAADAIYVPAGGTGVVNLTGGLGNDTYSLANTTQAGTSITDTGGNDTLILAGTASNTATMNAGATFAAIGIDQIITNGTAVNTVAPGQIGAQTINAVATTATTPVFTLASAGALNVSSLTTTAIAAANLPLTASGAAVTQTLAVTAFTLNGSTGADTITGSALADTITTQGGGDSIVGGNGIDAITLGAGVDTVNIAAITAAANRDTIASFTSATDFVVLGLANTTATTVAGAASVATSTTAAGVGGGAYAIGTATSNANDVIIIAATASGANTGTISGTTDGTELLKAMTAAGAADTYTGITATAAGNSVYLAVTGNDTSTYIFLASDANSDGLIVASEITLVGTITAVTAVAADFRLG